jgi:DNA-binding transcriptional regulator PaaX
MTQAPTLNGQVIGQAERATRAVLEVLLAETNTPFVNWVTLNLIGNLIGNVVGAQGETAVDALIAQLIAGLRIEESEARSAVDDLVHASLVTVTDRVRLTPEGLERYQRISDGIGEITRRLYRDLPHDDLVVARRVLETLTDRARAELASTS